MTRKRESAITWSWLLRLLAVDDTIMDEQFMLTPEESHESSSDDKHSSTIRRSFGPKRLTLKRMRVYYGIRTTGDAKDDASGNTSVVLGSKEVKPISMAELHEREKNSGANGELAWNRRLPTAVQHDLAANRAIIDRIFYLPTNADIVKRDFEIGGEQTVHGMIVFVDGIADKTIINTAILEPLMLLSNLDRNQLQSELLTRVKNALLPGNQVMEFKTWKEATENILAGSTVLFLEGVNSILSVETKGWEHRTVSATQTESVVRGPHDGFTESFRANTGLVRSKLRSSELITEITQVGKLASTDVAIMYIKGVVNPKLVREVKKRLKALVVDYLPDSGLAEQFLEDDPIGVIPKFLSTERPDRVAYGLTEGQVAIFIGHSPFVLLAPVMFWSLLHTSEDAYLRWPYGTFIRAIRMLSLVIALLLPALYIAVTNYHPEMIPTDLMLAVAATRERVPFPVVTEVLVMEFSIELIREAGIRIPSVIGPTIGIVGALILGQAAVAAGIISPLLIIVVAVTALGSFTMPNYNLSFSVRLLRFGFIIAAATFGFYGIILGLMLLLMHMVTVKSFGVPMMAPIAPHRNSSPDVIRRGQVFQMETRPNAYFPLDKRRQKDFTRTWSPVVKDYKKDRKSLFKE